MQLELKIGNTDLADALQRYIEQRLSFELGHAMSFGGWPRTLMPMKSSTNSGPWAGSSFRRRM